KNVQRHINIHDVTPDSGLAVDYSGHTDETSGDESESMQGNGILAKVVKSNLPANKCGYKYLNSDDMALFQQKHQQQEHFPSFKPSQIEENNSTGIIRPIVHRTLKGRHSDSALKDAIDDTDVGISVYPKHFTSQQEMQILQMQQELQKRLQQDKIHQRVQQEKVHLIIQHRKQ
ncbi:unnamed protein product, partial [Meganyctiphanes norvegica]